MLQHFNMVKIESRPQTVSNQVEISHQLSESQYPEKVNDLYVQSIYSVLVVKAIVVRKSLAPKGACRFESDCRYNSFS